MSWWWNRWHNSAEYSTRTQYFILRLVVTNLSKNIPRRKRDFIFLLNPKSPFVASTKEDFQIFFVNCFTGQFQGRQWILQEAWDLQLCPINTRAYGFTSCRPSLELRPAHGCIIWSGTPISLCGRSPRVRRSWMAKKVLEIEIDWDCGIWCFYSFLLYGYSVFQVMACNSKP